MTSEDSKIYDDVLAGARNEKEVKIKKDFYHDGPNAFKKVCSCTMKMVVAILAVSVTVLALGLAAACTYFVLEIAALKSQNVSNIDSELTSSGSLQQNTVLNISDVINQLDSVTEELQQLSTFSNASYQQLQEEIYEISLELNSPSFPASSCAALRSYSPSGYYWVRASNGTSVRVYCDMTRSCGGITGGWMRVAHLDMTNSSQQCPSGFNQRTDSSIRSCVKNIMNCLSISAPTILNYESVCGKVIAYQKGAPNAFRESSGGIDSPYVDGVSITHGSPRQHIWTFAAAIDEVESGGTSHSCPCIRGNIVTSIPSFVGENYFCDTGSRDRFDLNTFYTDPLWDGAGCEARSTCCSFNTPPWFYRQLPQSTTDNIEIRVCTNSDNSNEDIAIETFDIFVQ